MDKWADYLISGIWFSGTGTSKHISHLMIHEDSENSVGMGRKKSREEVVSMIDNEKKKISTIRWNYVTAAWSLGALVLTEEINGVKYLRTHADASVSDNLDNLLKMAIFGL